MREYKKLVRIKYDNRLFDIFVDNNHRKFFLEVKIVDGKETYFYINLKDYLYFDKIYNYKENVLYSNNYKFSYKVIISASLALILTSAINLTAKNFKLQHDNKYAKATEVVSEDVIESKDIETKNVFEGNEIIFDEDIKEVALGGYFNLIKEPKQTELVEEVETGDISFEDEVEYHIDNRYLNSTYELDSYGVKKVNFDDVRNTFEQNKNIPDEYRTYVSEYIDLLEERLPLVDLRTFNENLKKMKFETIELNEWTISYADAYISCGTDETVLTFKSEYPSEERKKANIIHELSHALRLGTFKFVNEEEKKIYYLDIDFRPGRYCSYGDYFNEGFNTIIEHYLLSDDYENFFNQESHNFSTGYEKTPMIYQILKLLDGKYNIYDFLNYDVTKLEPLLEEYRIADLIDLYDVLMVSMRNPETNIVLESKMMATYEDSVGILRFNNLKEKGLTPQQISKVSNNFSDQNTFLTLAKEDFFSGDWFYYYDGEADVVTKNVVNYDESGNLVNAERQYFNPSVIIYHDGYVIHDGKLYNVQGERNPEVYLIAMKEDDMIKYTLGIMKEENKYFDLLNYGIFDYDDSKFICRPLTEILKLSNLNITINFDNFDKTDICQKMGEELINKIEMNDNKLR